MGVSWLLSLLALVAVVGSEYVPLDYSATSGIDLSSNCTDKLPDSFDATDDAALLSVHHTEINTSESLAPTTRIQHHNTDSHQAVVFCGYDGKTWMTRKMASLLFACNISVNYPGECGCPNFCNNATRKGVCSQGQCFCKAGWKGVDCSSVDCASGNDCSGNGRCESFVGIDQCTCNSGFTGPYCQSVVLPARYNGLPYGQFLGPQYWPADELYGDFHPVFNRSVIASVHIRMPAESLELLRSPSFLYQNATYLKADMVFTNGHVKLDLPNIGIKCKGFSSRKYAKKSWKIDFSEFSPNRVVYGLKKLGLKANSQDITLQRSLHESDLLRAVGVASPRSGYAALFINDINFGMFWLEELEDKTWLKSRFGSSKGNLYKVAGGLLSYHGRDPDVYKRLRPFNINITVDGLPDRAYRLKYFANDSYQDLTNLITALNSTTLDDFPRYFDVDLFLRSVVVISSVINIDTFSTDGNNYMLWRQSKSDKFEFITFDFDASFSLLPAVTFPFGSQEYTQANVPPLLWGKVWPSHFLPDFLNQTPNPLTSRLLAIPAIRTQFIIYYKSYLHNAFHPNSPLIDRITTFAKQLQPYLNDDLWFRLDFGKTGQDVEDDINNNFIPFVQARTKALPNVLSVDH